jgi:hypothetical protein
MEAVWAATSPASGRFSPTEVTSTVAELLERYRQLKQRGEGYLEVRLPDSKFPVVTVGFRAGVAVAHAADGPTAMALLRGDGSVPSDQPVEVLIMDEAAEFSGVVAMTVDHSWELLIGFLRTGRVGGHRVPL